MTPAIDAGVDRKILAKGLSATCYSLKRQDETKTETLKSLIGIGVLPACCTQFGRLFGEFVLVDNLIEENHCEMSGPAFETSGESQSSLVLYVSHSILKTGNEGDWIA